MAQKVLKVKLLSVVCLCRNGRAKNVVFVNTLTHKDTHTLSQR